MKRPELFISIQPRHAYNILTLYKTIEARKNINMEWAREQIEKYGGFWVNMYVTLGGKGLVWDNEGKGLVNQNLFPYAYGCPEHKRLVNGKVVARFWCNEVEEIYNNHRYTYFCKCGNGWLNTDMLCMKTKLEYEELDKYFQGKEGCALYVNKVEVFEKPKELKDFYKVGAEEAFKELEANLEEFKGYPNYSDCGAYYQTFGEKYRLQNAPQSWCYVEGDE